MEKYFCIIRVFPSSNNKFDFKSKAVEFESQDSYEVWKQLRVDKSIREYLDNYTKQNLTQYDVIELREKLVKMSETRHDKVFSAQNEYYSSPGTQQDLDKYKKSVKDADDELTNSFTNLITSEFTKEIF